LSAIIADTKAISHPECDLRVRREAGAVAIVAKSPRLLEGPAKTQDAA
jgi:hypothetical protein